MNLLFKRDWKWRSGELSRLAASARIYRLRLAVALAAMLGATAMALAMPQALRLLIDAAFVDHDSHRLNQSMFVLMGVFAGMAVFSFLRSYLLAYVGESVVADLRVKLYDNLTRLSLSFFGDQQVGVLTSRLTSDVAVVQSLITSTLGELLRQGLTMVGTVAIVALTNPRLTLAMLAVVPLI
jgi:ATP-binding cassette, subfamily B, bacterial MsbA